MKNKSLIFITTEEGCFVPISHKLNQDGYFRKRWKDGIEMFHRFIWRAHKGEIPQGYEINHKCGCRSCSNIEHLECISGEDHAILTNRSRYREEIEDIKLLFEQGMSVEDMCKQTGKSKKSIYSYRYRIRKGKLV